MFRGTCHALSSDRSRTIRLSVLGWGVNRCGYVGNNPLARIDPSGFCADLVTTRAEDVCVEGWAITVTLFGSAGVGGSSFGGYLGAGAPSGGSGGGRGGGGRGGGGVGGGNDTSSGEPPSPEAEAEGRPLDTMLCHAGNSVAGFADTLGDGSTKLLAAGLVIAGAGFVTAQPQIAGPGLALAATGGIGNIGAGVLQFGAGLLQGGGGAGFANSGYAALSLGTGFTLARGIVGPGASGYRTVSQRANDAFVQGTATIAGGVQDLWTTLIDAAAPRQVSCSGGP